METEFNANVSQLAGVHPQPLRLATVRTPEAVREEQEPLLPQNNHNKVTESRLNEAVTHLNDYIQVVRRELQISIDEGSGRAVITVLDAESREVIREIPPEEVISLADGLGSDDGHILNAHT